MSDLNVGVPDQFAGTETVRVVQDSSGPRDYVPGRGADMVPSKTGPGDVFFAPDDFQGDALTFTNVNKEGKRVILEVARGIVEEGKELTHRDILQALAARASEV